MKTRLIFSMALLQIWHLFGANFQITRIAPTIFDYAASGNAQKISEELKKGTDPNKRNKHGVSLLGAAVMGGFKKQFQNNRYVESYTLDTVEAINELLARGADKAQKDILDRTPYTMLKEKFLRSLNTLQLQDIQNIENVLNLISVEDEQEDSESEDDYLSYIQSR